MTKGQAAVEAQAIVEELRSRANTANVAGMARFGINVENAFGISVGELRALAKVIGRDHPVAGALWDTGVHEARILATLVEEPARVTPAQMDRWAREFDSWDVCDQACQNLFRHTPHAFAKAAEWAHARPEFLKRAAFALMAGLTVSAKTAPDAQFEAFLPLIAEASTDERNFVKKAVNWALRQIGKRNPRLSKLAIAQAEEILRIDSRAARWIARDALRELRARSFSG
jgi:3-methyladenine DNA glycosylase AlkD